MAFSVTRYLASLGWTVVPHPPYSPDLASCDFFLFLTMKKTLKGKRYATVEEVKTASQEALNNIKLQQFQRCFTQWEKRLDKCIASNGEYFEGDQVFFVRNVNKSSFLKEIWIFFGPPPTYEVRLEILTAVTLKVQVS